MLETKLSHGALQAPVEELSDDLWKAVLAAAVPVPLTIAFGIGYGQLLNVSASEIGTAADNIAYGIASLVVLGIVYVSVSHRNRQAVLRFQRPGRTEILWVGVSFVIGIVVFPVATVLAEMAGAPTLDGFEYTLADTRTVLAVIFGGVLVAPFVEEVLFRGYLLGSLLGRGLHPVLAGSATIGLFALIHFPLWGVAGVVGISAWSTLPTILRLRFDNVTGAWLLHLANNIWSNLIIVGLGFV